MASVCGGCFNGIKLGTGSKKVATINATHTVTFLQTCFQSGIQWTSIGIRNAQ